MKKAYVIETEAKSEYGLSLIKIMLETVVKAINLYRKSYTARIVLEGKK